MSRGLTAEDLDLLRQIDQAHLKEPGELISDVSDAPANRRGRTLTEEESRKLVKLAQETSNRFAAHKSGVSVRTVERHRSYWQGGEDCETVTLQKTSTVDDRLCGAMRMAAHDGDSLTEIAERHGLAKSTVQHHISVNSSQECNHKFEVTVPRFEFKHGGMRGNGDRKRNRNGQFTK